MSIRNIGRDRAAARKACSRVSAMPAAHGWSLPRPMALDGGSFSGCGFGALLMHRGQVI